MVIYRPIIYSYMIIVLLLAYYQSKFSYFYTLMCAIWIELTTVIKY